MPDIPNRDDLERQYARAVSRLLKKLAGDLLEALGDPPNLDNLNNAFWDARTKEALALLVPFGERVFLEAAQRLMEKQPIGIDWALVNERASAWASNYSFELVRGITETTKRQLQRAISAYFAGQTRGQLEERIRRWFSPVRAEMIAVTEVTRAAAMGEMTAFEELKAQGIEMGIVWQTNRDELVCPICAPRNGKKRGDGWQEPPPAHPRCRCWINLELPKVR
jgi:hypothetical protein